MFRIRAMASHAILGFRPHHDSFGVISVQMFKHRFLILTFFWRLFAFKWSKIFFKKLKSHFLYCWRSESIDLQFTFLHTISVAYVKELFKLITVGCIKRIQGEVCASESSYHLFSILSHFRVSLEHECNSIYWDHKF